jgi:hypothetical protein
MRSQTRVALVAPIFRAWSERGEGSAGFPFSHGADLTVSATKLITAWLWGYGLPYPLGSVARSK